MGVPKTQDNQERRARLHIIPYLGQLALRNITAADLRAYIAKLGAIASSVEYQRGILSELSFILEAAVDDKRLARNPMHAKSVRWPKAHQECREAWLLETALRVRDVISSRSRIAVLLGLGCGLRQGEVFGLSPEDIDYRERRASRPPPSPVVQGEAVLHSSEGREDPRCRYALLGGRGAEAPCRGASACGGGAPVGEAGGTAEEVLPAAHHTIRQRHCRSCVEHQHLEACAGRALASFHRAP
ncbi:site-specific integrase [Streptomyces sp. ISL-98]|uniref:site-specific integrase n=1 Tax=Streptomyces sp. ISL-98 TaxID=2819192 RepID=UPI0027E45EF6|nr:site-specific integrase [Streptomyces sp. ISL-98]